MEVKIKLLCDYLLYKALDNTSLNYSNSTRLTVSLFTAKCTETQRSWFSLSKIPKLSMVEDDLNASVFGFKPYTFLCDRTVLDLPKFLNILY